MENEIWKDIIDYEGLYQISNIGRVKSMPKVVGNRKKRESIMKRKINVNGYYFVGLCKDSKYKWSTVHKLVGNHFVPNPYNFKQLNHIDGNRLNPDYKNLEWCDQSYNMLHSYYILNKKGLINKPVERLDNNGNVIDSFFSLHSIKKALNISSITSIYYACIDNNKTAYGSKWRFKD